MRRSRSSRAAGSVKPGSAFSTTTLGLGGALVAGVAVLLAGGGFPAAIGAYMLTGSTMVAGIGMAAAARPSRSRIARLTARLRRPVAAFIH